MVDLSLQKRDLQRRHALKQQNHPANAMDHLHSDWMYYDVPLLGNTERVTSVGSYTNVGYINELHPIPIMFAVSAYLIVTYTFASGVNTFSLKLEVGSLSTESTYTGASTFSLAKTDIRSLIIAYFKNFKEEELHLEAQISNVANPVDLHGAFLRFLLFKKDTYGDYQTSLSRLLIWRSDISKDLIAEYDRETSGYEYLSGIALG